MGNAYAKVRGYEPRNLFRSETGETWSSREQREDELSNWGTLGLQADTHDGLVAALALYFWSPHPEDFVDASLLDKYESKDCLSSSLGLMIAGLLHWGCVFCQFWLVFLLFAITVEALEDPFEHGVRSKIGLLQDAVQSHTELSTQGVSGDTLRLCSQDQTLTFSTSGHAVVLIVWGCRMLKEFIETGFRVVAVLRIPSYPPSSSANLEGGKDLSEMRISVDLKCSKECEKHVIVAMTHCVKALLVLFVSLPHFLNSIFLAWTGAKLLMLTTAMLRLIGKSIALQFIATLDEMFFTSIQSGMMKKLIKEMSYLYRAADSHNQTMEAYGKPLLKMACVAFSVILVHEVVFGKIHSYRDACDQYFQAFPKTLHEGEGMAVIHKIFGVLPHE